MKNNGFLILLFYLFYLSIKQKSSIVDTRQYDLTLFCTVSKRFAPNIEERESELITRFFSSIVERETKNEMRNSPIALSVQYLPFSTSRRTTREIYFKIMKILRPFTQ